MLFKKVPVGILRQQDQPPTPLLLGNCTAKIIIKKKI
jgi:hypothetical protein